MAPLSVTIGNKKGKGGASGELSIGLRIHEVATMRTAAVHRLNGWAIRIACLIGIGYLFTDNVAVY